MLDRLLHALIQSKNAAADDVLLDALRIGSTGEKQIALMGLLRRKTVRGLGGVIENYHALPETVQGEVLRNIKLLHHALRECGRSDRHELRLSAIRMIALGRQGKLAYVLSENMHESDERLSKAAVEAVVALARWTASAAKALQKEAEKSVGSATVSAGPGEVAGAAEPLHDIYEELLAQRPEIEEAVARAMDVHRGKHGQDLLRAALLLSSWPGSKTLAILHTAKHGGQSAMVRRLQQPPESEHVEAFLLGASHGQLRSHFGVAFAHIDEAPVLDALLRRTHWLKDHQLGLCLHQVTRGTWFAGGDLHHDIERRTPEDAARIGEWIAASGIPDTVQDERLEELLRHGAGSFETRIRLLRIVSRRRKAGSVQLILRLLS
ncbi:MAG TPA: hypothetical protein VGD75_01270, partial [Bradyrhizobium sp.]